MIPCYNEAKTLPITLSTIKRDYKGIDETEILIINDGSYDETSRVAIENGVDYIVLHKKNRGLARAFATGLSACMSLKADVIVNTDADNQYDNSYIQNLIDPILCNRADIVIGTRPIKEIKDFSFLKKKLQILGSFVVSKLSGIDIPDTTSGFRAYSSQGAQQLSVVSKFTYTLETIIQAGKRGIPVECVPVKTNPKLRESRLFASSFNYIIKSIHDMVLISTQMSPLYTFTIIGGIAFFLGAALGVRFIILLVYYSSTFAGGSGYIQSLLLATLLMLFGSTSFLIGLIADQVSANRILLEKLLTQRNVDLKNSFKLENAVFSFSRKSIDTETRQINDGFQK